MKQLFVVQPDSLDRIWEQTKGLVEKGMMCSDGELTLEQIRLLLVQGHMRLLISKDIAAQKIVSALVVEIIAYPNYRCVNVVSIGGEGLNMDQTDIQQLKHICKQWGASKIQGYTHKKMTSYLVQKGFEKKYDIVRLDIEKDV